MGLMAWQWYYNTFVLVGIVIVVGWLLYFIVPERWKGDRYM